MSQIQLKPEETLLISLRNGDRKAFESIYKNYWGMVLRFVQLNNGNKEEAEELYQESIIVLFEKLQSPDFTLSCSIKTYLYSICRNKWLHELRGKKKITDIENYVHVLYEAEEELPELPQDEDIYAAVLKMGDPCYSLLKGYYYEKFSLESLASKMKYASANVAKQQKFRCIERLKKAFLVNKI